MAYEVIARKWRPQQLADVVGQGHVTQTLVNAITSDRVAHAYLFVGPRGTGKTTTARILAKCLNCETGPTATPCDACDACREIVSGSSLDVLEIDGASNNGVEQVRDLRQNVQYAPARGPYKIYIIDEVHMLSQAAFNALLKTLEEPPPHVKFVFATTAVQKLPATILSRCQRFDLRRIPVRDIVDRLQFIATEEGLAVEPEAMLAIARGAEGGMRDAQSALDQIVSFRGSEIREADVLSVFGLVSWEALKTLTAAILRGDIRAALQSIADLDGAGKDLQRLGVELLEYFRNLLVWLYTQGEMDTPDLTDAQIDAIRDAAADLEPVKVLRIVDNLMKVEAQMKWALSQRTLLETAVIHCARAATVITIDELVAQVECIQAMLPDSPPPPDRDAAPPKASSRARTTPPPSETPAPEEPPTTADRSGAPAETGDVVDLLRTQWAEFVDRVGHYAPMARGYLLDASPIRFDGTDVVIGFDPEFGDNKEKIDVPRNRSAIGRILSQMLGRSVGVTFGLLDVLEDPSPLPSDHAPATEASGAGNAKKRAKAPRSPSRTHQEWLKDPAVQKTLETFQGDILDIRD